MLLNEDSMRIVSSMLDISKLKIATVIFSFTATNSAMFNASVVLAHAGASGNDNQVRFLKP